jgi:hypothetical protein
MASRIPNLNDVVLSALDLHSSYRIPALDLPPARRRLVVASGNALPTGRIVFAGQDAVFADEGQYQALLASDKSFDGGVVISASGTKHGPVMVEHLKAAGLDPYLLTCAPDSPAAKLLDPSHVVATKSQPEPITYNTSTYMGMILSRTGESAAAIRKHLLDSVRPKVPDLRKYRAFYLIVPEEFGLEIPMFITKFDELFGGRVAGRCYTLGQTLHAKTVVPWKKELFISFGEKNKLFGSARLDIRLPRNAGLAGMLATGYYVIGHIQKQLPAWFRKNAADYAIIQKKLFEKLH